MSALSPFTAGRPRARSATARKDARTAISLDDSVNLAVSSYAARAKMSLDGQDEAKPRRTGSFTEGMLRYSKRAEQVAERRSSSIMKSLESLRAEAKKLESDLLQMDPGHESHRHTHSQSARERQAKRDHFVTVKDIMKESHDEAIAQAREAAKAKYAAKTKRAHSRARSFSSPRLSGQQAYMMSREPPVQMSQDDLKLPSPTQRVKHLAEKTTAGDAKHSHAHVHENKEEVWNEIWQGFLQERHGDIIITPRMPAGAASREIPGLNLSEEHTQTSKAANAQSGAEGTHSPDSGKDRAKACRVCTSPSGDALGLSAVFDTIRQWFTGAPASEDPSSNTTEASLPDKTPV